MNPIQAIRKLQALLKNRVAPMGLEYFHSHWTPGENDDDPAFVTVYFKLNGDTFLTEDDLVDKEFQSMMAGFDKEEEPAEDDRIKKAKEQLRKDMKNGLFNDDIE